MDGVPAACVAQMAEGGEAPATRPTSPWMARPPRRRARADRAQEVLAEIGELRDALRTSLEQYERRVSGQLAEVVRALHRDAGANALTDAKSAAVMLGALRGTELKPHRGRAKDLLRIQDLVAELAELATPKG